MVIWGGRISRSASDTDMARMHLLEALEEHSDLSQEPSPNVQLMDILPSLDMGLRAYSADITDGISIRSDLRFPIYVKSRAHDKAIPFLQWVLRTAPVLKGHKPTLLRKSVTPERPVYITIQTPINRNMRRNCPSKQGKKINKITEGVWSIK